MSEQMTDDAVDETPKTHSETADVTAEAPAPSVNEASPDRDTVAPAESAPQESSLAPSLTERLAAMAHKVTEQAGEVVDAVRERVDTMLHSEQDESREPSAEPVATDAATQHPASVATSEPTDEAPDAVAASEPSNEAAAFVETDATDEPTTTASPSAASDADADSEGEGEGDKGKRKRGGKKGGRKGRKLDSFKPGDEVQGTVRSVQAYGAFIDVGAERDGLVHISELRDGFVDKVEDVVKEGQQVTVRVKEVDIEKGRLSLTMRSAEAAMAEQDKEKRLRLRDLTEGQELEGRVNSIVEFGAFIDIGATTDGLVHISELSDERVNRVSDILQEGQEVKVRILGIDKKRNRISLTMREQVAAEEFAYEQEDDEELPSVMQLAYERAQERNKKDKRGRKQESSKAQDNTVDDIISRTLNQHRE